MDRFQAFSAARLRDALAGRARAAACDTRERTRVAAKRCSGSIVRVTDRSSVRVKALRPEVRRFAPLSGTTGIGEPLDPGLRAERCFGSAARVPVRPSGRARAPRPAVRRFTPLRGATGIGGPFDPGLYAAERCTGSAARVSDRPSGRVGASRPETRSLAPLPSATGISRRLTLRDGRR